MTDAEWLQAADLRPMLEFLRTQRTATKRKMRLFAAACSRRLWHLPGNGFGKPVIEVLERFADGLAEWNDVLGAIEAENPAMKALWPGWGEEWRDTRLWEAVDFAAKYRPQAATDKFSLFRYGSLEGGGRDEPGELCYLIREMFGNPFRRISINPAWLRWHDGLLVSMARRMYDSRDFRDMPVLADALEEAGCEDQDILGHCRSGGEHVRGCWVVDLVLGKS
jgi:hypothetical protein